VNYTRTQKVTTDICQGGDWFLETQKANAGSFLFYSGFFTNKRTGKTIHLTHQAEPIYVNYDPTRQIYIMFGWYPNFKGTTWFFEKQPNGIKDLEYCSCEKEEKNTYKWSTGDSTKTISVNASGTYSVTITDCENCQTNSSVVVNPCNAKIGDKVFFDDNGNGALNSSEAGVANITLNLLSVGADSTANTTDDVIIKTTKTDSSGNYFFTDVASGSYYIQVVPSSLPSDKIFTTKDVLNNQLDEFDSDVDEYGRTEKFLVRDKVDNLTYDIGIKDKPKVASVGN
jgi:hypothetical protein